MAGNRRQHFVDQRRYGAAIGNLLQTLLVDDLIGRRALSVP